MKFINHGKKKSANKALKWSLDSNVLKEAGAKGNLEKGLRALEVIWKKGVLPQDLKPHNILTWFSYSHGNLVQLAKFRGVHRNTYNQFFSGKLAIRDRVKLRYSWREIFRKKSRLSYPEKVGFFINKETKVSKLPLEQSAPLVNLWLMGVPWKVIRSHYVLLCMRKGMEIGEIAKRMKLAIRTIPRVRDYALQPGSPVFKWLAPIKPTRKEWFGKRGGYRWL